MRWVQARNNRVRASSRRRIVDQACHLAAYTGWVPGVNPSPATARRRIINARVTSVSVPTGNPPRRRGRQPRRSRMPHGRTRSAAARDRQHQQAGDDEEAAYAGTSAAC